MELTQEEIARALGVEEEVQQPGGTEHDTGADTGTDTGAEETGGAAQGETRTPESGGTEPETETGAPEGAAQEQDVETRRRQAYGRRQREMEAQRQASEAAAQARVDRIYADMFAGQVNPYTGQPIRSEADYRAYQEADRQAQRTAQLQSAGIDPDTVRGMVDEAVRPLRAQVQRQELAAMREMARSVDTRAQESIRQGVETVRQLYGAEVSSVEDIVAMPTGQQFNQYIQKGLTIEEAYYMANRREIDAKRLGAARQAGINRANGKGHLAGVGTAAGQGAYQPTAEEKAAFREFMPDATDAEIAKAYAPYHKS